MCQVSPPAQTVHIERELGGIGVNPCGSRGADEVLAETGREQQGPPACPPAGRRPGDGQVHRTLRHWPQQSGGGEAGLADQVRDGWSGGREGDQAAVPGYGVEVGVRRRPGGGSQVPAGVARHPAGGGRGEGQGSHGADQGGVDQADGLSLETRPDDHHGQGC